MGRLGIPKEELIEFNHPSICSKICTSISESVHLYRRWHLKDGVFTVKYTYHWLLIFKNISFTWARLLKSKCPLKIKMFIWLSIHNKLPTGGNLFKTHIISSILCSLCRSWDDDVHSFITCLVFDNFRTHVTWIE